jgi:hypothetical protein
MRSDSVVIIPTYNEKENIENIIRAVPYAPMVKLADRMANVRFSLRQTSDYNHRMAGVYREEWPHFLASLWPATDDPRMGLPQEMVLQLCGLLGVDAKGMFED